LVCHKIGMQMFYGRSAGGDATGAAVVSDPIEIARDRQQVKLVPRTSRDSWSRTILKSARPPDL
jgi:hypothetical protein